MNERPDHLKHRLRKAKRRVLKFLQKNFAGLFDPFCPGCNVSHPDWTTVSGEPWFCRRCFEVRNEPVSPWEDYPRPLQ